MNRAYLSGNGIGSGVGRVMNHVRMIIGIVVLAIASVAGAQGTSNAFPDPVSSRQLDEYAERLGLDSIRRLELDPYHEAYREQFRTLRDGRIEEYLKSGGGMGMMSRQRDRAEIESRVKERKEILRAIERLDAQFIEQIRTVAGEDQATNMAAVKLGIERARAKGVIGGMFLGNADIDVAELVQKLPAEDLQTVDEATREGIRTAITEYEKTLTRQLEKLAELAVEAPLASNDALAAMGVKRPEFKPDSPPDHEAMGKYFEASTTARSEAMKPQTELRKKILQTHHAFLKSMKSRLPLESYRELRHQFLKRSYAEAWPDPESLEPLFEQVLKLDSMSDAERSSVLATRESWRTSHDAVTAEMIESIDESRGSWGFFSFDEARMSAHQEKMKDLFEKRAALDVANAAGIRGILGDRVPAHRDAARAMTGSFGGMDIEVGGIAIDGGGGMIVLDDGEGAMTFQISGNFTGMGQLDGDGYLPAAMSTQELAQAAELMKLTADQKSIVEVIHEDYQNSFREIRDGEPALKQEPMDGEMNFMTMSDPKSIEQLYSARKSAIEQMKRLDAEFFDGLIPLLGDVGQRAGLEKARLARQRKFYNRKGGGNGVMMIGPGGFGGTRESSVDLVDTMKEIELSPEGTSTMSQSIDSYEPSLIDALRRRLETVLEEQKKVDLFHARMHVPSDDGSMRVEIRGDTDDFKLMEAAQAHIEAADRNVADLNVAAVDEISAKLTGRDTMTFKRAWQRAAYPSVFRDPKNAETPLMDAIKLEDSTPEQVEQLNDVLQAHRTAYETLCDEMVAVTVTQRPSGGRGEFNSDGLRTMQARDNAMKKLRFDRTELNASGLRKLKAILTPEQAARMPALQEKKDAPDGGPIFFPGGGAIRSKVSGPGK